MTSDRLEWYRNIVSALNRAGSEETLETALEDALDGMLRLLECSSGVIRIDTGQGKADLAAEVGAGGVALCFENLQAPGCACAEGVERITVSHGIDEGPCHDAHVATVICAPVASGGRRAGLFFAASEKRTDPPDGIIEIVERALENIADTVFRVREAKTDRKLAADMETVNTIGRLITATLKLKDMVREIVSKLGHVLETDEVNVIVYDDATCELSFLASYFADGSNMDRPEMYPLSDGINSWIIKNRQPLLMSYDTVAECEKLGIRHGGQPAKSWLGAPMIYKDRVVGVLSVQSYRKTGLYDSGSVELLGAVANQCAVAVENARLFEEIIERETEKERLYFSLTHDLLSLINPVAGFAKILKSLPPEAPADNLSQLADNIIMATEKITRFAEDILVYAKIKSGKLALDISRRDVFEALASAIQVHLPELKMRGIRLTVNGGGVSMSGLRPPAPIEADYDRAQMERVLLNCIGNAVKHTRSRIDIEVERSNRRVSCRILDDGDGVPSDEVSALFEEYYQSGTKQKGVGLGLPSVKKIIELHNGSIRIESDRGAGFLIEFSWPRTLADRRESGAVERSAL